MRRSTIVCAIAAGILALAPFSAAVAAAAPQYTSSDPANGAELHEAPAAVSVSFSEPLDAESELRVFACGKRVDDGGSTVTLNELEVSLASGPTGLYEARWVAKGFGGVTGTSAGLIEFTVGHGEVSCGDHGSHGGHDGKGKGGHDGKGHGGEGNGHEGKGHSGSGHSGSGHSEGSGHSGSGHSGSGTSHSSGSHSSGSSHSASGGHSDGGHGSGGDHGKGKGKSKGHGANHGNSETPADDEVAGNPNFAADGPLPIPTPEAGAVVLALLACIGLGITGGWLARLV